MSVSGIDAVLGHVVAQQVVVHRVVEGHRELHALPGLRIALVLVLDAQRDGLAVDVLHRRHGVGDGVGAGTQRDGERHRRQHMRGVVFLVQGLVADHRPAGGLDHLHVEAVLGVEAHGMRHDDRRGAGNRNKADLQVLLLRRRGLGEGVDGGAEREELRDGGERRGGADGPQEGAARLVLRDEGAHDGRFDHAGHPGVARQSRRLIVLRLARVGAAAAAGCLQGGCSIERILKAHGPHLCNAGSGRPPRLRRQIGVGLSTATAMPAVLRCHGSAQIARTLSSLRPVLRLDCAECPKIELIRATLAAIATGFRWVQQHLPADGEGPVIGKPADRATLRSASPSVCWPARPRDLELWRRGCRDALARNVPTAGNAAAARQPTTHDAGQDCARRQAVRRFAPLRRRRALLRQLPPA